jgi:hypothetical protein
MNEYPVRTAPQESKSTPLVPFNKLARKFLCHPDQKQREGDTIFRRSPLATLEFENHPTQPESHQDHAEGQQSEIRRD